MLMRDDPLKFADDAALPQDGGIALEAALSLHDDDGYRCLEALGDDLSLENTPLVDMDDLLYS